MTVSLKALAGCIGLSGPISIVHDFFGYASGPPWSLAPAGTPVPASLSVLTQAQRLGLPHFHLDLIRVGTTFGDLLDGDEEQATDCAVQVARDIYGAEGIGIGRVNRWWFIPIEEASGFDSIDDDAEAEDLVDSFSAGSPTHIDVFIVPMYVGGIAGVFWPGSDGVVVEAREDDFAGMGRTLAHELGHFFGLDHGLNVDPTNLMTQSKNAPNGFNLSASQVATILAQFSWMRPPC